MVNPAAIKAAAALLSDERTRKGIGWVVVAILSPLILLLAFFCALGSGATDHNIHEYRSNEVEWLLVYEKPLEALYAHWVVEQPVDFDTEFEQFFRDGEYEEQESGMDAPGMC